MLPNLVFALPHLSERVSGGNIYNAELMRALATRASVSREDIDGARARIERGEPGLYFVDSLNLSEFAHFPGQRLGQRYGLIVHHLPSLEPGLDPAHPTLQTEHRTLERFDVLLATSTFTAEILGGRGHEPERILTVPPAPPLYSHVPRTIEQPFAFALVGNLISRKSILELLKALDARLLEADRFFIDLAGRSDVDLDYAADCLQFVRDSGRLRAVVRYLGPLRNDEVLELYRSAAGFVSAAKMETFGMAIQEARACGVPILALDGGYARNHFTHGKNGQLFSSVEELADGMLSFVRAPARLRALFDSSQRLRLNSGYTWQRAADSLIEQLGRYFARFPCR